MGRIIPAFSHLCIFQERRQLFREVARGTKSCINSTEREMSLPHFFTLFQMGSTWLTTAKLTNLWLIQTLVAQICSNLVNEINQIRKKVWGWVVYRERGIHKNRRRRSDMEKSTCSHGKDRKDKGAPQRPCTCTLWSSFSLHFLDWQFCSIMTN